MVKAAWSYPVDIWNVGVMVWDLFEGKHMFHGNDPDGKGYSTRAHLAEVIGTLGPPP
jgi:serine/threonine-protein kinase SRPK3